MRRVDRRRRRSEMRMDEHLVEGLEEGQLRRLLTNTIDTIEDNKTQIFDIYEAARGEVETSRRTLEDLRELTRQTIKKVDELSEIEQREKRKLAETSSDFGNYSEERIREETPARYSPAP